MKRTATTTTKADDVYCEDEETQTNREKYEITTKAINNTGQVE